MEPKVGLLKMPLKKSNRFQVEAKNSILFAYSPIVSSSAVENHYDISTALDVTKNS